VSAATKVTAAMTTVANKDTVAAVTTDARKAAMVVAVKKENMAAVTMVATVKKAATEEVAATAERRDATEVEVEDMAMTVPPAAMEVTVVMTTAARRAGMAEDVKRDTVEVTATATTDHPEAMETTVLAAVTVAMVRMNVAMRRVATVEAARTTHTADAPAADKATAITIGHQVATAVAVTEGTVRAHQEAMAVAPATTAVSTPLVPHTAAVVATEAAQTSSARQLTTHSKTLVLQETPTSSVPFLDSSLVTSRSSRMRTSMKTMLFSSTRNSTATSREAAIRLPRTMSALLLLCRH